MLTKPTRPYHNLIVCENPGVLLDETHGPDWPLPDNSTTQILLCHGSPWLRAGNYASV